MKFLFKLLTKAGKIARILEYVYTGMLAAISAMNVLVENLPEEKVKKIRKALKFVNVGADALRTVLGWFGMERSIENAESNAREITLTEFQEGLTIELKSEQ